MSLSDLLRDGGLTLFGLLLAVLAIGLLAGAALGYFTASTDLDRERAKAWDLGYEEGVQDERQAAAIDWPEYRIPHRNNPYRKRQLAPAPPHLIIPTPDPDLTYSWTGAPQHPGSQRLFDQDAPTDAARAIELRGDD